jgi:3-methyladenine DNA glycosylase AlkD
MTSVELSKLPYIVELIKAFKASGDKDRAQGQAQYMRNHFSFFGIGTAERRKIQKPFLEKGALPAWKEAKEIIKYLWKQPQRELQYFAQELAYTYCNEYTKNDIQLFRMMITTVSWWDTVDYIATKIVAAYFLKFTDEINVIKTWMKDDNLWIRRTAILFQLKYKDKQDRDLLEKIIKHNLGSNEFFINKAIGWILREIGKTDPKWVSAFVVRTPLSNLSKREGMKYVR